MVNKRKESREKKKEMIISFITQYGRSPTSKIASIIGLPSNYATGYLDELATEKKVIKEQETNSTYWKIK